MRPRPTHVALALLAGLPVFAGSAAGDALPGTFPLNATPVPGAPGPVTAPGTTWQSTGPIAATAATMPDGTPGLSLAGNVSLLSGAVDVPAAAQTLDITAASSAGALLIVSALPVDGGPGVPLGVIEPDAAGSVRTVSITAVAGRAVRLLLDPSAPLGGAVVVGQVGPFAAPLPGWTLRSGAPQLGAAGGTLQLTGEDVRVSGPRVRLPGAVRQLLVSARGSGLLAVTAGSARRSVLLEPAWRDLTIPVAAGATVSMGVHAVPGSGGPVQLRDLGTYVWAIRPRFGRTRFRARTLVLRGSLGSHGAGVRVAVRWGRRVVSRGVVRGDGTFGVVVRRGLAPLAFEVVGDRTHLPGVAPVRAQLLTKRG
ncbi:MAG: hypothetical protein U0Y82_06375 [Thermoleophilia bacterium]